MGRGTAAAPVDAVKLVPLVAAAAAGGIAVGVLLLAHGGSPPTLAPTTPLAVRASFIPSIVQFGDPVTARIVVVFDTNAVRSDTLHVSNDFAPFTPLSAKRTTRTTAGRTETLTITQRVACLTEPCLAHSLTLPAVHASAGSAAVTARWGRLQVRSRLTAAELARSNPRFAADTAPAAPSYRVTPGAAETALDVIVGLAAAGAAALLALEALARMRRRRVVGDGDELARALRLVRESENRPARDRRRALNLLSRVVPRTLGRDAAELAWRKPAPQREDVDALIAEIERERAG